MALLLLSFMGLQTGFMATAQERKAPPKTRVDNVTETLHGTTITDPYRWLEDKDSPETRAWLKAQNEYTDSMLSAFPGRDRIRQRLTELLKIDTIGVPTERGGRYFFTKRSVSQNQPVIYVRNGLNGKDEVLIDPNSMSEDQTTSVNIQDISDDGKLLVYGVRQGGKDEVALFLLDVDTRKQLADRLPEARYFGISMKPDKSGFYYTRFGKEGSRVHYHAMGADPSKDEQVFGEGYGPGQIISADLSDDGRWLILSVSHGSSGDKIDLFMKDVANNGPIKPIVKDVSAGFSGEVVGDQLYLATDWEAPNGRVLLVDLKNPERDKWKTVIPEGKSVMTGFSLVGGKLFASYLDNVASQVKVFEPSGKHVRDITLPSIGSASAVYGRWNSDEAFFTFNSFARPTTIYRYQVSTAKQDVWARINVPVKGDDIEVKQVWYESKDKTRIPMFIIHKKGIKLDGNRPTLLYGYGGFNVNMTPSFSARAAFWAESGGVFAMPNLRGGGEFGETWHKAGMLDKKQNVFDDFIAAAEWLIQNKYTGTSKLAISGGSNGGLLVGAAMTQRPDLFQAVVCSVPLLDMVRYHQFLVARFWVPEYGSSEDPQQFKFIHAYSPYHRVKAGTKYPAVMFVTGDADTRVDPLHARKMTALMQAATASDRPVLLHYDTKAGHSGGLPINKVIDDLTDEMSFLFWQLGVQGE
ncbi:MAG TPA: prolyl oligopeptidase family serine peptidase [Blastocatellia bacterium]|nr:prolyl oligopeptidase family serine peptidase [Blastocatellia bacterium]